MVQSNTLYAPKTQLWLPGVSSNYATTSDDASLDITGDLCLLLDMHIGHIAVSDEYILSKWNAASNQRAYAFLLSSTSRLRALISDTGLYTNSGNLIGNKNMNNIGRIKAAFTYDASEQLGTLWYKLPNDYYWIIDATKSSMPAAVFSASATMYISTYDQINQATSVKVISAQIYSGIGDNSAPGLGTLVAEADFSYPWHNNKYTDETGKVWTINGSAWAWEYQDDPEDKYTPTPEIWGGDAYQLIDDQINNSSSALHVLNGGNARGY